jgi:hypothetical protein
MKISLWSKNSQEIHKSVCCNTPQVHNVLNCMLTVTADHSQSGTVTVVRLKRIGHAVRYQEFKGDCALFNDAVSLCDHIASVVDGWVSVYVWSNGGMIMTVENHSSQTLIWVSVALFNASPTMQLKTDAIGFGSLVVSILVSGTQVRGFKPGRNHRIFRTKISTACLPSEGK